MPEEEVQKPESISYEKLYRRWEENPWSAPAIDFTTDREHWHSKLNDTQREAALWNYALFLVGEEAVARTLTPLLDAAPVTRSRSSSPPRSSTKRATMSFSIASCERWQARAPTRGRRWSRWSAT